MGTFDALQNAIALDKEFFEKIKVLGRSNASNCTTKYYFQAI